MPSVCIPRSGLRILCQWSLDSGFLELNSGFLSPGNPDFESNNNPYYHFLYMGRCTKSRPVPLHRKVITIDLFQPVWEASRAKCCRSFPSSPGSLYQNEVKCSTFDMEMIFHSHASKTHFHKKVVHLASFWKWGFLELRSGALVLNIPPTTSKLSDPSSIGESNWKEPY